MNTRQQASWQHRNGDISTEEIEPYRFGNISTHAQLRSPVPVSKRVLYAVASVVVIAYLLGEAIVYFIP